MKSFFRAGMALLALVSVAAQATTPATGAIAPGDQPQTFSSGPNAVSNPASDCDIGTCDTYTLTVNVPAGFTATHPDAKIVVNLTWDLDIDYDLKAFEGGVEIASAGQTGSPETMTIASNKDGTRTIQVKLVPYAVNGGTAMGTITFVPGAAVTGGSSSGGGSTVVTPTVPNPVGPDVPRYYVYSAPDALSGNTGEPSIAYNIFSKRTMFLSGLRTLWLTYPQNLSPAKPASCDGDWADRTHTITGVTTLDPIGLGDGLVRGQETRRIWAGQLAGKAHLMVYTEDDGFNWSPTEGNAPVATGFDHQGIATGPYPKTGTGASLPHPLYKNAFYYCGQDIAYANCTRSDDGGTTFNPPQQMYQLTTCNGLHGHPRVGPDGTVYVPNPSCGGNAALAVSEDAGITWTVRKVPGSTSSGWDPQYAIATDNTGMMCHADGLNAAYASFTKNKGVTWTTPKRLGEELGIQHVAFTQAVAGTPGRFTCAYLGTRTKGNPNAADFTGIWHLYLSSTYDNGATWVTVNATPNDPVQGAGGIWDGGGGNFNRNLLDFNEITIDENGYPIYGYTDGCVGSCDKNPAANSFTAHPRVARQVGGKPLYADRQPGVLSYAPPESCLAGTRNAQEVNLAWREPENGGSAISGYKIYRSEVGGEEVFIGETGPKPSYRDLNVEPSVANYFYKITAINSSGEGLFSNEVKLPLPQTQVAAETLCTVPGVTIATDGSGDGKADNTDILAFSVAEPADLDGNLIMQMKVKSLNPVAPGTMYTARFHLPSDPIGDANDHFVGMVQDGATPQFVYGHVAVTVVALTSATVYTVDGTLPGSTFTAAGLITFKVPHSKFSLARGGTLANFVVNTHGGAASTGSHTQRSQTVLDSTTGSVNYTLRSASFCATNTAPTAVLTANTSKGAGPLSVVFNAAGSSDAEDAIVEYYYDFGDGTAPVTNSSNSPVTHVFQTPARYTVQLKVKDARGLSSVNPVRLPIEVTDAADNLTAFVFAERIDVPVRYVITSEPISLAGFAGELDIAAGGGMQYSINNGPFTNQAGKVKAGDKLTVRHVSASAEGVITETFITVGGYTTKLKTTTTLLDHIPKAFDFGLKDGQTGGAKSESAVITLVDYDTASVSAGPGAEYRVNNSAWRSAASSMKKGDTLQARHVAGSQALGYTKSYIKVGGVVGYYTSRTKK